MFVFAFWDRFLFWVVCKGEGFVWNEFFECQDIAGVFFNCIEFDGEVFKAGEVMLVGSEGSGDEYNF